MAASKMETFSNGVANGYDHVTKGLAVDLADGHTGYNTRISAAFNSKDDDRMRDYERVFIQDEMIRKLSNECVKRAAREQELSRNLNEVRSARKGHYIFRNAKKLFSRTHVHVKYTMCKIR